MLLDRVPKIDSRPESGSTLPAPGVTGNITIRDGVFCYPTRPGLQVHNRSSAIQPGQVFRYTTDLQVHNRSSGTQQVFRYRRGL